jgi:phosphoribosylformimino-5-aminoimidazole carboxamide ribotide isomerase
MRFEPIPAVDIRGGRCVRLAQGDFAHETVYAEDPVSMAQMWEAQGARRLHVVDLDGARAGSPQNAGAIRRLLAAARVPVQVGGGIRTLAAARTVLDAGADRVVVGSAVAEEPARVAEWLAAVGPEHFVVGVDARRGRVAIHGWVDTTGLDVLAFSGTLADAGVRRILYTDIGRDGMLQGPNVDATRAIVAQGRLAVLASGGVSTLDHLAQLADAGAEGAIVGTALYAGRFSLAEALAYLEARTVGAC